MGKDIRSIDKYRFRSQNVGVIFQSFNLLPNLTAEENVILSMEIAGIKLGDKRLLARDLLEKVGLDSREISRRILKLSGGQQQRVAIARALAYDPHIILADEPTGNLDGETQEEIMEIFRHLAHQEGRCIIIVTHSPAIAEESDEVFRLARETGRKKQPAKREAPAKTEEPSQAPASPEKTDSPAPSRTDTPVIFSPPPARSSRPASKRPHEISRKVISRQEEKEYQEALQSFLNAQPVEKKERKRNPDMAESPASPSGGRRRFPLPLCMNDLFLQILQVLPYRAAHFREKSTSYFRAQNICIQESKSFCPVRPSNIARSSFPSIWR